MLSHTYIGTALTVQSRAGQSRAGQDGVTQDSPERSQGNYLLLLLVCYCFSVMELQLQEGVVHMLCLTSFKSVLQQLHLFSAEQTTVASYFCW